MTPEAYSLTILFIGFVSIILMISVLRLNAFIALITSAMIISLLAPGEPSEKISRVAEAFGHTAGDIAIVIALACVIGKCMTDSGAADRIVRSFLALFGEKQGATTLMSSGFILSIPVFFDTVFYLLIPLARSMHRHTKKNYLKYLMVIASGALVTHMYIPPTPGPLIMAKNLNIDLGILILVGLMVALPSAIVGMIFSGWRDKKMNIPMRELSKNAPEPEPLEDHELPALIPSILPIVLPVLLITSNTIMRAVFATAGEESEGINYVSNVIAIIGNVNFAMLVSAAIAMWVLSNKRHLNLKKLSGTVGESLLFGGVIILITAAGGACGAMLKAAQIAPAAEKLLGGGGQTTGFLFLLMSFIIGMIMKTAQGSGTVAVITASSMVAAMIPSFEALPFHPVYLATACGSGSFIFSWMNDSGFWIFSKMGGLTENETLKSWTPLFLVLGFTGFIITLLLVLILPLK